MSQGHLRKIPDVATISRHLKGAADSESFDRMLQLIKEIVYQRIFVEGLTTLTCARIAQVSDWGA